MLRRLVCNGYFWLLAFSLGLGWYHYRHPFDTFEMYPDSYDYTEMVNLDISDPRGLATFRTWGYPVLLKGYRWVVTKLELNWGWSLVLFDQDEDWEQDPNAHELLPGCYLVYHFYSDPNDKENASEKDKWLYVPTCQLLLHIIAVLVFYRGLRELNFPATAGVMMCLPILFNDFIEINIYSVLADAPGQSFLLFTITSFFFVLRKPHRPLRWISLMFCVFAAYQIRPAFQFLLIMLPLVTAVLGSHNGKIMQRRWVMTTAMLLVCWLPYLGFCSLRQHMVGHFGLVSYTGFNFFGLCGQLFTDEMVYETSSEHRTLAEVLVYRRRDHENCQKTLREWTGRMWHKESHGWIPPLPHGAPLRELDYDRIQDQYSWLVWRVEWKYLRDTYGDENGQNVDIVAADRALLSFSMEFIRNHPDIYAMCMLIGWQRALVVAVVRNSTWWPLMAFGVVLLLAAVMRLTTGAPPPVEPSEPAPGELSGRERLKIIAWTAVSFYLLSVQLIVMVVAVMMPGDVDGRYTDSAATFLPCLVMLGIWYVGRYLVRASGPQRVWVRQPANGQMQGAMADLHTPLPDVQSAITEIRTPLPDVQRQSTV